VAQGPADAVGLRGAGTLDALAGSAASGARLGEEGAQGVPVAQRRINFNMAAPAPHRGTPGTDGSTSNVRTRVCLGASATR
jgi:hypothetical protein